MNDTSTGVAGADSGVTGRHLYMALIPIGIVINLGVGALAQMLKLPIYLDAIGTISMTILLGMRAGIAVGVLSFLIGGLLVSPVLPWFSGTQLVIAIYVALLAKRGAFKAIWRTVLTGIGLGVVAGVVSAPVIVLVYGGIDGSGTSVITAFLIKSGKTVVQSVIMSGIAAEPCDKTIQCLLAVWLLKGLPGSILRRFSGGFLAENGLMKQCRPA